MMKDDDGVVQIYSVSTTGGETAMITSNDFAIETSFDIDPSGDWAAYGVGQKIYITKLNTGDTVCITLSIPDHYSDLHGIQWSHSSNSLAYNRKVTIQGNSFYHIFTLTRNEN